MQLPVFRLKLLEEQQSTEKDERKEAGKFSYVGIVFTYGAFVKSFSSSKLVAGHEA